MKILMLIAVSAVTLALGCTASPATSPDAATPNIEATVAAAIQMAIPNPTAAPTPNIDATVEAKLRATLEAAPTQMPTATPFPKPTLSALVELVRPSVVRIETDSGMGSGFVISVRSPAGAGKKAALIMTNHHVIRGAQFINVTVNDRERFGATVLEDDPYNDIALIEICCGDFTALKMASNADVAEGEQAIAIGYPLALEGKATVTDGIISATRFDNQFGQWIIQTDAAINPGNSGGPLVSSDGKVLGVNTRGMPVPNGQGGFRIADGIGIAVAQRTLNYILDRLLREDGDPVDLGEKVTYHDNAVYFLSPVTRVKAQQYMDSLTRRGIATPEGTMMWQLRLVDGEYEIRAGLYDQSKNRYLTIAEQQERLINYHADVELRQILKATICERQKEDFDDVPTTFFMVDLTTPRFDSIIQWIPCVK